MLPKYLVYISCITLQEFVCLFVCLIEGTNEATGKKNKKVPRSTSSKESLKVDTSLSAS